MRYTIERTSLFEALQRIQTIIEKKNMMPILGNILCMAQAGKLVLSATNLDVGVKITLEANVEVSGQVTILAKKFLDIVRELPNQPLHFQVKENHWIEILSGKSKFHITGLPAEQYPALPSFAHPSFQKVKPRILKQMIDQTSFAASADPAKCQINGVFCQFIEVSSSQLPQRPILRMVGMDGHRLSISEGQPFELALDLKKGIIIPQKGVLEFRKIVDDLKGDGDTMGITLEKGYLFLEIQDFSLFIRLIEGDYPEYQGAIPSYGMEPLEIEKSMFQAALTRVGLLANEKSRAVKFKIQKNSLLILSSDSESGEAMEEVDIKSSIDGVLEVAFNSTYLLDCLSALSGEKVFLYIRDSISSGLIQEESETGYQYIVMPMRV